MEIGVIYRQDFSFHGIGLILCTKYSSDWVSGIIISNKHPHGTEGGVPEQNVSWRAKNIILSDKKIFITRLFQFGGP